jgi:hypothetical protein
MEVVEKTLVDGTTGFTGTANQERYDECEAAVTEVLHQIRQVAHQLKVSSVRFILCIIAEECRML